MATDSSQGETVSSRWKGLWAWGMTDRRPLVVSVLLFFLIVGGYYVGVKGVSRSAINRWKPQVVELWQGEDIYLRYGFPTPPVMAILLTPFCLLPGSWTMLAWFVAKVLLTVGVAVQVVRRMDTRLTPMPTWVIALGVLLSARPVMGDLLHGNVNLFVMGLVVGAILLFVDGRDLLAGGVLSLAVACKLTPALVVLYFAWKRQWRLVAASLVGLVVWWVLVPGLILGWERNGLLWRHWADYVVQPYVAHGAVDIVENNQSAVALIHRWIAPPEKVGHGPDPASFETIFLARSLVVGLIILLAWLCRTRWSSRLSPGWWHELGVVFLTMLMVSERSWKHHFVWLLPMGLALSTFAYGAFQSGDRRSGRWIVGLMGGAFVAMLLTSQDFVRPWAGEEGAKWMQAQGAYVWASVLLGLAHAIAIYRQRYEEGFEDRASRPRVLAKQRSAPSPAWGGTA